MEQLDLFKTLKQLTDFTESATWKDELKEDVDYDEQLEEDYKENKEKS